MIAQRYAKVLMRKIKATSPAGCQAQKEIACIKYGNYGAGEIPGQSR